MQDIIRRLHLKITIWFIESCSQSLDWFYSIYNDEKPTVKLKKIHTQLIC